MRSTLLALLAIPPLALTACKKDDGGGDDDDDPGTPDALTAPAFRNPVDLPDDELALQALQLLGAEVEGADRNCDACHGLTRARLHQWQGMADASLSEAVHQMHASRARHLVVVARGSGRAVGVLSTLDVLRALAEAPGGAD